MIGLAWELNDIGCKVILAGFCIGMREPKHSNYDGNGEQPNNAKGQEFQDICSVWFHKSLRYIIMLAKIWAFENTLCVIKCYM